MYLITQRLSALEVFFLVILVTSTLSSALAVYRDIQVYNRFYAESSKDDRFTISGTPISRAMLPLRLLLMTSLLVSFVGVRSRKFGGRLVSTLGLMLLIGLYLLWWRSSFYWAKTLEDFESTAMMSHTLYLKDGNWLDVGVFFASLWALGWLVVLLITDFKGSKEEVLVRK